MPSEKVKTQECGRILRFRSQALYSARPFYLLIQKSMDNTNPTETPHTHCHSHIGVYIAIAASTIISLIGTYFFVQQPQIDQVGGRANYELYKQMVGNQKYADNVKQSLESQEKVLSGDQPAQPQGQDPNQQQADQKTTGTLTTDEIAGIMKNFYVRGNPNAQILWVEYSDLECPFCKRLHDSGAIKDLEAKYGDKLAFEFKHFPLPFHPTAMPAANAAECVGEMGGKDKFYAFIEEIFSKGTPTQDEIDGVVKDIGLDAKKVKTCADSGKYKDKIAASQSEGSSKFGINGTPGNVLINTKTGKYEIVSGAQPESAFNDAITRLMAQA